MQRVPVHVASERLRLTPAEAERLALGVQELARRSSAKRTGQAYQWTFSLAPVAPGRRR